MEFKETFENLFNKSERIIKFAADYSQYLSQENKNFINEVEQKKAEFSNKVEDIFTGNFIVVSSERNMVNSYTKIFYGPACLKKKSLSAKTYIADRKDSIFVEVDEKTLGRITLDDENPRFLPGKLKSVIEKIYVKESIGNSLYFFMGPNIKNVAKKLELDNAKFFKAEDFIEAKASQKGVSLLDTLKVWVTTSSGKGGGCEKILRDVIDDIKQEKAYIFPRRGDCYCELNGDFPTRPSYAQAFWAIDSIKKNVLNEENDKYYVLVKYGDLKRIMKAAEITEIPDFQNYVNKFYEDNKKELLEISKTYRIEDDDEFSISFADSIINRARDLDVNSLSESGKKFYNDLKEYASYGEKKYCRSENKKHVTTIQSFCGDYTSSNSNVEEIKVSILDKYPILQFVYNYSINSSNAKKFFELIK